MGAAHMTVYLGNVVMLSQMCSGFSGNRAPRPYPSHFGRREVNLLKEGIKSHGVVALLDRRQQTFVTAEEMYPYSVPYAVATAYLYAV